MGLAQVTHPIDLLSFSAELDEINLFSDVATGTGIFAPSRTRISSNKRY
jgi:hypothetical protein